MKAVRRFALILMMIAGLWGGAAGGAAASAPAEPELPELSEPGKHRLLVYMIGGDLEDAGGALTADLLEIARAGAETEVIARAGGTVRWWMPGWTEGHAYDLRPEDGGWRILRDLGSLSLGETGTFLDFLQAYGTRGADLILWGHGFDGLRGIGYDAPHGGDTLTLPELEAGLKTAGIRFRLIGLDACRMATLECAWLTAPFAEIFAASARNEDLSGWRYARVLPAFAEDAEGLASALRSPGVTARDENGALTVLRTAELLDCGEALRALMNRAAARAETVNELAGGDDSPEARQVQRMLNGRTLLFTWYGDGEEPLHPEILGDAYLSYVTRIPAP